MRITSKEIVDKVKDLLPMPEVSIAINERISDDNFAVSDIADIVQTDPTLSARLIRIANSPFYGYQGQIDDLNRAVMLVGTNGLRDLVWACESIKQFSQSGLSRQQLERFWDHSLFTAMAARTLAKKCKHSFADRMFLTGLLHDIGILVMYQAIPKQMSWVWDVATQQDKSLYQCEIRELGIDHFEVGAEFLRQWGIPETIVEVVRHQRNRQMISGKDEALINIATYIAYSSNFGYGLSEFGAQAEQKSWQIMGLSEKIVDPIRSLVLEEFYELRHSFFGAVKDVAA